MPNIDVFITGDNPAKIEQTSVKRDWMDATGNKHAYNCFPVGLANTLGWGISFPEDISFIWDGISDSRPHHVKILSGKKYCNTVRSNATISFLTGLTFKTDKDVTALIMPTPNLFIEGVQAFTTLLSTSFFSGEIPIVLKVTTPNKIITIPANTPISSIIPISLNQIGNFEVNLYEGSDYVGSKFDGGQYGKTIAKINAEGKWAGFYRNATDHEGNKIGEHEIKTLRLKTNVK